MALLWSVLLLAVVCSIRAQLDIIPKAEVCDACTHPGVCTSNKCCSTVQWELYRTYVMNDDGVWCVTCSRCPELCMTDPDCRLLKHSGKLFCFCFPKTL